MAAGHSSLPPCAQPFQSQARLGRWTLLPPSSPVTPVRLLPEVLGSVSENVQFPLLRPADAQVPGAGGGVLCVEAELLCTGPSLSEPSGARSPHHVSQAWQSPCVSVTTASVSGRGWAVDVTVGGPLGIEYWRPGKGVSDPITPPRDGEAKARKGRVEWM
ncbi:hypothetical protein AAY473_014019 [Plecturocebus cupreus]